MSSHAASPTLYIIYNATSTVFGKVNYVYRNLTCPDPDSKPACAACELTHGPSLRLKESPQWVETKNRILNAKVVQVHQDEMPRSVSAWMKGEAVATPALVVSEPRESADTFKLLLTKTDLAQVRHDHEEFLQLLQKRATEEGVKNMIIESNPSN